MTFANRGAFDEGGIRWAHSIGEHTHTHKKTLFM